MKCQLSFDSNDKICTQPSNRMGRYTRRDGKNELTKWKSNGSKLVCAITDLEEITGTMKRTHQIKTYGGLAMSKKDTDTVTQHVRTQCTRNFVEWFHPSSAEQPLLLVFLFRPTHKTKPTILISFEYKTKKYVTLFYWCVARLQNKAFGHDGIRRSVCHRQYLRTCMENKSQ